MKTKLLFTRQKSNAFYYLLVLLLCFNYGYSQELVQNGTCDEFQGETGDNADAWDMTPNSEVVLDGGTEKTPSPYKYDEVNNPNGWNNAALEEALAFKYLDDADASIDEQPGSTSNGNNGTRGVKLYDDGNPSITGSSRRLYQRVVGLTIGSVYDFSIDSKSEAVGTPSQVYILNTQITSEEGIDSNGYNDPSVDYGMDITNDNPDWVTNTFSFTATNTEVVIYVRSLESIDDETEVFYDNISLQEGNTQSIDDVLASKFKVYPNPARDYINIQSKNVSVSSIDMYNILGAKVLSSKLTVDRINVSSLAKGVYLMKINSVDGSVTKKVVID
ncbi:T9SS type A sorting domain-containing protein [Formosa sp. PL04]|uniref:T9SS type A sorting domain-containing protein n=1 Tax=Formosa sp. PL04 TaxID=3081755 RepID=UPI0029828161|nr:T9SS type A sorting domain-containing protein [Formosa sp. PL04]MDW5290979.1 T9SS type A sorting domain-containing protein [Formosa sp. PL04]